MAYNYPTVILKNHQVAKVRSAITALTDEGIQESLGVSRNTWKRISEGQPIKVTTFNFLKGNLRTKGIEI